MVVNLKGGLWEGEKRAINWTKETKKKAVWRINGECFKPRTNGEETMNCCVGERKN